MAAVEQLDERTMLAGDWLAHDDGMALPSSEPITAVFQDDLNGYSGTRDTRIRSSQPTANFGSSTRLELDGNPNQISLIRWDTIAIPVGGTVTSASITLNVVSPSVDTYEVYEGLRPWNEQTANYELAATGQPWEVPGAAGPTDHAADILATLTGPSIGLVTIGLNAAGVAVVQKWITDPSSNLGLVIQDLADQTTDDLDVTSSEVAGLGPRLTVTYTVEINPPDIGPQYEVKHPPRLQLGNAALLGFSGSDTDQVEVLWETVPVGSGTSDSFTVQYREVDQTGWSNAAPASRLDTGVEGRIIHSAIIGGIAYDSQYEYRVQHLRSGHPIATYQATFHTRLPVGSITPFTFVAYGDSADLSNIDGFRSVQNRINQIGPHFALLLGDNIYDNATHEESDIRFDPTINPEAAQWSASHIDYPSIGNHEVRRESKGEHTEQLFSVPIPVLDQNSWAQPPASERPEHNYSFDYGNVHFLTFDTNSVTSSKRLDALLTWVEQDLQASDAQWKIVFGHHPVAGVPDKSESPSDDYYQQVVPRLVAAGVDLFLVGHSHTYGRSYPLLGQENGQATFVLDTDSVYTQRTGLVQVVSGVGGKERRSGTFSQFPFVAAGFSSTTDPSSELGFSQIEVTPSQLTIRYIAASDGHVIDTFAVTALVTASLQDGLSSYQGTRDTRIRSDQPTVNFGASTKLELDGNPDQVSLIGWDTSGIPAASVIRSASITFNVLATSVDSYEVYESLRPWNEKTANYQAAATGQPWEVPGAAGTTDHAAEVLATLTAPSTGLVTIDLNTAGLAVIQQWIMDPTSNHGLIIQDLSDQTTDGLNVSSSEATGWGPLLKLTYTLVPPPPPNDPPVADDQLATTDEDTAKALTLTGSDANGGLLRFLIDRGPANGILTGTAPNLIYTPNANFNGVDSVHFKVHNGSTDSEIATVSITVNSVNDRPIADDLTVTTNSNAAVVIVLHGSDVDGAALSFVAVSSPSFGGLTGSAPSLTYTPDAGFLGTDTFTYQADDGTSRSTVATVTINVRPLSISFQDGVLPTPSYRGTQDTKIRVDFPTRNSGTTARLEMDGKPDIATLVKWDISGIPASSSVISASITINVVNTSIHAFDLYQALQPWLESTATFNELAAGTPWEMAGAQGPSDRNSTILGRVTAPSLGTVVINLNNAGAAVVQSWVNAPATNHGLVLQNYADANSDALEFTSREGGSATTRPKLSVEYVPESASSLSMTTMATLFTTPAQNPNNPYDVNHDSIVAPSDALIIINALNRVGALGQAETNPGGVLGYLDVSGDSVVTPLDVLLVFNHLNDSPLRGAAAEFVPDGRLFYEAGKATDDDTDDLLVVSRRRPPSARNELFQALAASTPQEPSSLLSSDDISVEFASALDTINEDLLAGIILNS